VLLSGYLRKFHVQAGYHPQTTKRQKIRSNYTEFYYFYTLRNLPGNEKLIYTLAALAIVYCTLTAEHCKARMAVISNLSTTALNKPDLLSSDNGFPCRF